MKKPKAPKLLTVSIFTTITIIFWVFFSVYRVLTTEPPVNVPPELLAPFSSELDIKSLDKLTQRVYIDENEIPSQPLLLPPISTPSPTPTQEPLPAEESESIQPTEVATESAVFLEQ